MTQKIWTPEDSPIGIWDLDGTIIDSIYDRVNGYQKDFVDVLVKNYGITEGQQKQVLDYFFGSGCGVPCEEQYITCLRLLELPVDRVNDLVREYIGRIYSKVCQLYPDVHPTLQSLRKLGSNRNCISTGMKQYHLDETAQHHGLGEYFAFLFGTTDSVFSKSEQREPIRSAFGLDEEDFRQRTYLVGDAFNDMSLALEWGVHSPFFVNRAKLDRRKIETGLEDKKADPAKVVVISSLDEVPEVLTRIFRP